MKCQKGEELAHTLKPSSGLPFGIPLSVLLGFILAIAGAVIQMLELSRDWSLMAYGIVAVLGFWLILFNRPVQLTLNKLRAAHEEAWR